MKPAWRVPIAIAPLLIAISSFAGARPAGAEPGLDAASVTAWIREHAIRFDTCEPREDHRDLHGLRALVGDARIVALGEGTHGTREFFQMKHRIVRFLAEEMGFGVFAIEANQPEAYRLNDYVLGAPGDPRALIAGMYFWTWNTEEVLALVEWMREHNASGKGRMLFTGFDMQFPDTAAAIVERHVAAVEPAFADSVARVYRRVTAARQVVAPFASATGTFPVEAARGRRIRFAGWIRTQDVDGHAGLWWRADAGAIRGVAFDNMQGRRIRGTTDWTPYELALDIPDSTTNINFGCLLSGGGTAWFDSLSVHIDDRPWSDPVRFDGSMEIGTPPRGLAIDRMPRGYRAVVDTTAAVEGRGSLRIERFGVPADPGTAAGTTRGAADVAAHLSRRAAVAGATEADRWAAQNARIVEQAARLAEDHRSTARDSCMAANVDWILERNPGTRMVIWAHNGHVARRPGAMGHALARRHGKDLVVLGFAFNDGRYTAWNKERGLDANLAQPAVPGSFEAVAHASGLPRFVLDLRPAPGDPAAERWLEATPLLRGIGAVAVWDAFHPTPIRDWYDGLIYVDHTEPSRLLSKLGMR